MRALEGRIIRLEREARQRVGKPLPCHRIIVRPGEDAEATIAALVASGAASSGDRFIVRTIIRPVPGAHHDA